MKLINLQAIKYFFHRFEVISGILVGIISGSLTNFIWQNNILTFSVGVIAGSIIFLMFYHELFHWFTKQPWFFKKQIPPLGRKTEIGTLAEKIKEGQSCSIVGVFCEERIEILDYLRSKLNQFVLYDEQASNLIFSYIDITAQAAVKQEFSPFKFWEYVLKRLEKVITDQEILKIYNESKEHDFEQFYLDNLFDHFKQKGWRLVLMIDRFHRMTEFEQLNNPSFFASLRSLSSHHPSPLVLIITMGESNQLSQLRTLDPKKGSYVFNFLHRMTLGALEQEQIEELLRQSKITAEKECQFLKECAGGHPYLLGKAIEILKRETTYSWFIKLLFFWQSITTKRDIEIVKKRFLTEIIARKMLPDLSTNMCEALLSVVEQSSDHSYLHQALGELEEQGFLVKQAHTDGEWEVRSKVIVQFLAEKISEKQKLCK